MNSPPDIGYTALPTVRFKKIPGPRPESICGVAGVLALTPVKTLPNQSHAERNRSMIPSENEAGEIFQKYAIFLA